MLALLRLFTHAIELVLGVVARLGRFLFSTVAFNPKLGPLRHVVTAGVAYVAFALLLVYVLAPLRGFIGHHYLGDKLRYDAERWLATAIYDPKGNFIGTFDPRLDSQRDVNWTDASIEMGGYTANPDHKSIPVREVPEAYWKCLSYHEDRYIGGPLNPYGIDLMGVLKIPYSSVKRSIALKRPTLGVGGSTLPMQFVRVIYKTPPDAREGGFKKLRRKLGEWWLAPVIYHELTRGGDQTPLKQWAANHLWLAQRTGGAPLHGVEMTARVVFGKEAKDLTTAEQFVLASAVNKPIILLEGSDQLNAVRLDHWRYITEVRARTCAERLVKDESERRQILFELVAMAGGPPDPKVRPKLQEALEQYAPALARRAQANPMIRANALLPTARFGLREELKDLYGFGWREQARGVTTTFDVSDNLAFSQQVRAELARLHPRVSDKLNPGFVLDPSLIEPGKGGAKLPHIIVVAANAKGEIVRYFDSGENAAYFGSPYARDGATGRYIPAREPRRIASTGKMLVAIAAGNEHQDGPDTPYTDAMAPASGLDSCAKGDGTTPRTRRAIVAFACSLNRPVEWRAANLGQSRIKRLIDGFGFNMPPAATEAEATPPSTAAVRGLISGSPRRVHHMAGVILGGLVGEGHRPVAMPTLIKALERGDKPDTSVPAESTAIVPNRLMRPHAHGFVKTVLQAPLCYRQQGTAQGTLKSLSHWCATERPGLKLHFAKTGTDTNDDPNQTVDVWVAGGLQFANGQAFSYVVVVGTGSTREPFGRSLHAAQVAAPLLEVLLNDLEQRNKPRAAASAPMPTKPAAPATPKSDARKAKPVRTGALVPQSTGE
ncbi:MAG: transglycosylase domain-containing protein [Hyphomicrobiaceae bacterium]